MDSLQIPELGMGGEVRPGTTPEVSVNKIPDLGQDTPRRGPRTILSNPDSTL